MALRCSRSRTLLLIRLASPRQSLCPQDGWAPDWLDHLGHIVDICARVGTGDNRCAHGAHERNVVQFAGLAVLAIHHCQRAADFQLYLALPRIKTSCLPLQTLSQSRLASLQ
jgi:hypothetical protein